MARRAPRIDLGTVFSKMLDLHQARQSTRGGSRKSRARRRDRFTEGKQNIDAAGGHGAIRPECSVGRLTEAKNMCNGLPNPLLPRQ
jgi:hypothetical protein